MPYLMHKIWLTTSAAATPLASGPSPGAAQDVGGIVVLPQ
ncbi:MAG: hypothetical protein RL710_1550, partial [Pseudomonadota bacterium]